MSVRIAVHSSLRKRGFKQEPVILPFQPGLTIEKVLDALDVQKNVVGVILVDGHLVTDLQYGLADGSELELYPLFAGG